MNLPLFIARRYLFARKSHNVINIISGISVAGMAIGTAALIITLSIYNGFDSLIRKTLGDVTPDILVVPAEGKAFIPDSTAFAWVYDQDNVLSMSSIVEEEVFMSYGGKQSLAIAKGVDMVYEEESPLRNHVIDGTFSLRFGEVKKAIVGASLAYSMGINPRFVDPITIYYPSRKGKFSPSNPAAGLRSADVYPSGILSVNSDLDASMVVVPMETMRELLEYEEEVTGVEIRMTPGSTERETAMVIQGIKDRLGPGFRVLDRFRQNESLYKMMRYEKLAIYMILLFIIIIIAFNIFGSLTMLIIEKEGDIATLRSLGADAPLIRRIFVLEGWMISLLGLAIGLVLGIGFVILQQQTGMIRMPGNYIITAYPVILKAKDIIATVAGVAVIGYIIALLPVRKHRTESKTA